MSNLTPEQERQIIDDLTALGWTRDLDTRSIHVIGERLGCSTEDADLILQRLQAKKMIEAVNESGGTPAPDRRLDSYGFAWVRK